MNGYVLNNLLWVLDPNEAYPQVDDQWLLEACGLIPHFLDGTDERSVQAQFKANYAFGVTGSYGGNVTEEGVYTYPEDPDLHPYMSTKLGEEKVYIYPYGLVSVVNMDDGIQFHTRLD